MLVLPFGIGIARQLWVGQLIILEVVLVSALRNLGLLLATLSHRPTLARLAAMVSLFLALVSSSMSDSPTLEWTVGIYAANGGVWLVLANWSRIRIPVTSQEQRRSPFVTLALALGFVGLVVAMASVGPVRATTTLASLIPSSGGTDWDMPDARGGVKDGANELKGSDSFGGVIPTAASRATSRGSWHPPLHIESGWNVTPARRF